jgi:beta-galactosidase
MAARLAEIVRREDPTRPVASACNAPGAAIKTGFAAALDVLGINYNIGEYTHLKGRILFGSETASAISSRGVYNLLPGADGRLEIKAEYNHQMSSYDTEAPPWANRVEQSLLALRDCPWVAGQFVWTGFDYIGEPTPFGWPSRSSYFGIFDLCGFPKDRAYLYQSQWTGKPMVHLFPHWNWEGYEGKEIPVRCYTNADSVELFLNGKSLGARDWKDNKTLHLEWMVPYTPGILKAVATKAGKVVATDEVHTAGPPAKIVLAADRKDLLTNGEDLAFITIRIEDKDGNLCPNADNVVKLTLAGLGVLAGTDNGDPTDLASFQSPERKAFHGLALAVIRPTNAPGDIRFTAAAEGLEGASVDIASQGK